MRLCFALLAGFFLALPVWAAPPNSPVTVSYNLMRSGITLAELTDTLSFDNQHFAIKSNGKGIGLLSLIPNAQIARSSEGDVEPFGLRPTHYREERGNKDRSLGADFDWAARRLTLSDNKEHEQIELPPGSLDRLSFPYSFAFLPKPPERLRLAMTDGRHLSTYEFKLIGRETITTPLGTQPALRYTRLREGDDPEFDLWLGVDQHLLPLRIVFTDKDGGHFEQVVTRIDQRS